MSHVVVAGPATWNTMVGVPAFPEPRPQTVFATGHHEGLGGTSAGKALTLARLSVDVTLRTALGRMAMERMLAGLSTRGYPVGLEPVGTKVEGSARSTSKSAVSRRFVAATQTALGELLAADLSGLDLVALMIDGVHFGEHLCVVALGIACDGTKHPLGLAQGSTENTTVVSDLLTGLGERGLDTTRAIFVGIDGGKALHAAVVRVFDHPVIQRCQLHKIRNVADKLPDHLAATVTKRMRAAYHAESAILAQAQLAALATELQRTHPGAAGSLREGLSEMLTVLRLDISPT